MGGVDSGSDPPPTQIPIDDAPDPVYISQNDLFYMSQQGSFGGSSSLDSTEILEDTTVETDKGSKKSAEQDSQHQLYNFYQGFPLRQTENPGDSGHAQLQKTAMYKPQQPFSRKQMQSNSLNSIALALMFEGELSHPSLYPTQASLRKDRSALVGAFSTAYSPSAGLWCLCLGLFCPAIWLLYAHGTLDTHPRDIHFQDQPRSVKILKIVAGTLGYLILITALCGLIIGWAKYSG